MDGFQVTLIVVVFVLFLGAMFVMVPEIVFFFAIAFGWLSGV